MERVDTVYDIHGHCDAGSSDMPSNLLNNVPFDIVQAIVDHLSLPSLYFLTRTCSTLHSVPFGRLRLETKRTRQASKRKLLESLTDIARALDDAWVCQECAAIHNAQYTDTPHQRALACPRLHYIPLHRGPRRDSYRLHHHHVQLAVKYSRLENLTAAQQEYLKRLLAPHAWATYQTNAGDASGKVLVASFTVVPKIVNVRYLKKCTWVLSACLEKSTYRLMSALKFCCHMIETPVYQRRNGVVEMRPHFSRMNWVSAEMIRVSGITMGSCYFCATEFHIRRQAVGKKIILESWQDLGPEASIYNPYWRSAARYSRNMSMLDLAMMDQMVEPPLCASLLQTHEMYGEVFWLELLTNKAAQEEAEAQDNIQESWLLNLLEN
ncbi:hypothetical protein NLG97_g10064 [Lecanicillium saksenae]|uniref:Uncharacterized protein n=1 Tax=Lecanicillium saksenae TaxID=468837 RepID=A0ACC1QFJ3_9HYPO|nr:hypothetical protein NLG97_g10064 [Lecanicillium saksenae]